jgi:hypothetical protein
MCQKDKIDYTTHNQEVFMEDRTQLLEKINQRRSILETAKINLKKYFVGLDDIIDEIIQNIESWFLFPESVTRPVIINLWGMTGVGKTDLIRKLVKELQMYDNFIELQMDDGIQGLKTIKDILLSSNIEEGTPGILLLDEIQRFRTTDGIGTDIKNEKFNDVWMILSDGRFTHDISAKTSIQDWLTELDYYEDWEKSVKNSKSDEEPVGRNAKAKKAQKEEEEKKKKAYVRRFNMSHWEAKRLKRLLRLSEPLDVIMQWDRAERDAHVAERMAQGNVGDSFDYTKLLIVICGNIDEAYSMSEDVADADIDADTLHAFSKKISIIQIKHALATRFKPEQISRFGNTHVIYRSLDKESYEEIIRRKLKQAVDDLRDYLGIDILVDPSINKAIYNNGVYPAQGVRPVFTTVSSVFEAYLPQFLLIAMERDVNQITVRHEGDYLYAKIGDEDIRSLNKVKLDLDSIRRNIDDKERALTSVHEAGHAIAYILLHKIIPSEVKSSLTNFANGYVIPHTIQRNKETIRQIIQMLFAGQVAEEIVFGNNRIGSGAEHDIAQATMEAAHYVRHYGMDGVVGRITRLESSDATDRFLSNIDTEINAKIEEILETERKNVQTLLNSNLPFLKKVAQALFYEKELKSERLLEIALPFVPDAKVVDKKFKVYQAYDQMFKDFCKRIR